MSPSSRLRSFTAVGHNSCSRQAESVPLKCSHMKSFYLSASRLSAAAFSAVAQSPSPGDDSRQLFDIISQMDTKIFGAFNAHDTSQLMLLFTDDLEFYHDKGGLTNHEQTAEGFKKLFASSPDIRRDLVSGTLEVYPIKDYGAIEI